jgi:hypothetical protein
VAEILAKLDKNRADKNVYWKNLRLNLTKSEEKGQRKF